MTLLVLLSSLIFLASCATGEPPVEPVKVKTVEIESTPPTVPQPDVLTLRSVNWTIITPENVDKILGDETSDKVFFALTTDGYEKLALNLSDLRAFIQQQKKIILLYEESYENSNSK